jgi:recombinational DNA repair ATPase RecF
MNYNKIIQQRNSYLKSCAENRSYDAKLLDVYDDQLSKDGNYIFRKRKEFLKECIALVKDFYRKISGTNEDVDLLYESQLLRWDYEELLTSVREKRSDDAAYHFRHTQGRYQHLPEQTTFQEYRLAGTKKKFALCIKACRI